MVRELSSNSQLGLTLVEVVLAAGLFGFVAFMATRIVETTQAASEGGEAMAEAVSLKHSLLLGLDCQSTLFKPTVNAYGIAVPATSEAHPACSASDGQRYFELVSLVPAPMTSQSYPQLKALIGKYDPSDLKAAAPYLKKIYVRASCVPCPICTGGITIKVEYIRKRWAKNGSSNWIDLFRGVPFACIGP
jgi:hypothetical protein